MRFKIGEKVLKIDGDYTWPGIVVGIGVTFKRYILDTWWSVWPLECKHAIHIFSRKNLEYRLDDQPDEAPYDFNKFAELFNGEVL